MNLSNYGYYMESVQQKQICSSSKNTNQAIYMK